ncbi:MAG: YbhB/YbcL family Raf kinase inhibitor-like protein [Thermodesulfobacteriota bacterium]|jgi:Raf kinase inhibitor-like YbhB/YbcL family protein
MALELYSDAFANGETIPTRYTCDGQDLSPPLRWTDPPADTRTLVLLVEDPDAPGGTWVHWVLYNLQGTARELAGGVPMTETLANGKQGLNDFGKVGYGGPCPPPGPPHRYVFTLSAVDTQLYLGPLPTKKEVEAAMAGHVLARAELIGHYGR